MPGSPSITRALGRWCAESRKSARACSSAFRLTIRSAIVAPRPPRRWPCSLACFRLNQPLLEELDDPLARLVGRVTVDLADFEGQHRMRRLAEAVLVARTRVDLDHLERVAQPFLERGEPLARRHEVL